MGVIVLASPRGEQRVVRVSAKALVVDEGRLLLQRLVHAGAIRHLLPGGGQKFGERLEECVQREVLEETGLHVRPQALIFVREFISATHVSDPHELEHRLEVIFRCDLDPRRSSEPIRKPDAAQVNVVWLPLTDLETIEMWPGILQQHLIAHGTDLNHLPVYLGDRA